MGPPNRDGDRIDIKRRDSDYSSTSREWVHLLPLADRRDVEALERARKRLSQLSMRQTESHAELLNRVRHRYAMAERDAPHTMASMTLTRRAKLSGPDVQVAPATLLRVLRGAQGENESPWRSRKTAARFLYANINYQVFQILLSLFSCGVYVAETYEDLLHDDAANSTRALFMTLEIITFLCFFFDFGVHIVAAEDPRDYIFSAGALVDVAALVPVITLRRDSHYEWLRFLRIFKAARLLRIHRLTRIYEQRSVGRRRTLGSAGEGSRAGSGASGFAGDTSMSVSTAKAQNRELVQQSVAVMVAVVGVIFIQASIVHTVGERSNGSFDDENTNEDSAIAFHDAVYYVLVTITTVGYGDIVPVSSSARLTIALLICVAFVIIPYQVTQLLSVLSRRSEHLGSYRRRHVTDRHLVLMGTITFDNLATSLHELFHPDHRESSKVHVVVLSPHEPSTAIHALIRSPSYRSKVTYLKGSPLNALDLERAAVHMAACVTLLINKHHTDAQEEDMGVVMRALSVANYCQESRRQGAGPRLFTELIQPQATRHLRTAGLRHVVCADALKLSLMGHSCLCPGMSTLLVNLMRSHSVMPPDVLLDASWYVEYYIGAMKQLYVVEFSPQLHHVRFDEAAALIFQDFELVLLGVFTPSSSDQIADGRVVLNPGHNYSIRHNDYAFVLADSAKDAQHIWEYVKITIDEEEMEETETALLLESFKKNMNVGVDLSEEDAAELLEQKLYAQRVLQSCKERRKRCTNEALIDEWREICCTLRGGATAPPKASGGGGGGGDGGAAATATPAEELPNREPFSDGKPPSAGSRKRTSSADSPGRKRTSTDGLVPAHRGSETLEAPPSPGSAKRTPKQVLKDNLEGVNVGDLSGADARGLLLKIQAELQGAEPAAEPRRQSKPPLIARTSMAEELEESEVSPPAAEGDEGGWAMPPERSWVRWKWGYSLTNPEVRGLAAPSLDDAFGGRFWRADRGGGGDGGAARQKRPPFSRPLLVVGMEPSMPHLDCLLRPFRTKSASWIWRRANPYADGEDGEDGAELVAGVGDQSHTAVPLVFMAKPDDVPKFCEALWRLGETPRSCAVIAGSPLSTRDLMRGGAHRAASVLLLAASAQAHLESDEETIVDSNVLVAFMKLLPLVRSDCHIGVELTYESNLRFLHPLHHASVRRLQDLGDDCSYLWPMAAAGKTFSVSNTDSLLSQAFYRPPIIDFIEQLLDLSPAAASKPSSVRSRSRTPDKRGGPHGHHNHHPHPRRSSTPLRTHRRGGSGHHSSMGSAATSGWLVSSNWDSLHPEEERDGVQESFQKRKELRDACFLGAHTTSMGSLPSVGSLASVGSVSEFQMRMGETSPEVRRRNILAPNEPGQQGEAIGDDGIYGRRKSRIDEEAAEAVADEKKESAAPSPGGGRRVKTGPPVSSPEGRGAGEHRTSLNVNGVQQPSGGVRRPSSGRKHGHGHGHHHHHHHHHHHEKKHNARIYQMKVPPELYQHSYGELYQELVAPPLNLVALGLYRTAGTKNSVEPYVYTAPRADTVLHEGDRVFVLGEPILRSEDAGGPRRRATRRASNRLNYSSMLAQKPRWGPGPVLQGHLGS